MKRLIAIFISLLSFCSLLADTYVVCVGIGNYADPRIKNLAKTEADAKAMAKFFKKGTENVITITGKYATKAQILKNLQSQFSRAKVGDKIIFYFSGHGYPGGFAPYDMTKMEESISYAEVIATMKNSKATDKLIFADACNSGAIRHRNTSSTPDPGNILMFLSSRGNEESNESIFLANGYFTKNLLRGLGGAADSNGDRKITASEIFKYVSAEVKRQTNDRQHPVMWGNFPDDLIIVKYDKK